jgi:myo-inositol-1-phosphate synthase
MGSTSNSVKQYVEETLAQEVQPRIFHLEQELALVNDNLQNVEKEMKNELSTTMQKKEEQDATSKKEFRDSVEGRLQTIKREITKLLLAVNGKMDEEEQHVESFTKKIYATMETANNLQFVLTKIRED